MRVTDLNVHDRNDVWFVKDDGSNLEEVMRDLLAAIESQGFPRLDAFADPAAVIRLAQSGGLNARPGSPVVRDVVEAARTQLPAN